MYGALAGVGVDAMAASQLTGYRGNAAAISMLDWENGLGTQWYWVVKMFIDTLGSVPKDVHPATVNGKAANETIRALRPDQWVCVHSPMEPKVIADRQVDPVYAQAFSFTHSKQHDSKVVARRKVVLLVNTRNATAQVSVSGAGVGSSARVVDYNHGYMATPYAEMHLAASGKIALGAFGIALVTI